MREALPSYLDAVTVVAGSRDSTILEREDRMRRASFMVSSSLEASRWQIVAYVTVRFSGGSSIPFKLCPRSSAAYWCMQSV